MNGRKNVVIKKTLTHLSTIRETNGKAQGHYLLGQVRKDGQIAEPFCQPLVIETTPRSYGLPVHDFRRINWLSSDMANGESGAVASDR